MERTFNNIGKVVSRHRKKAKLTQTDAARLLGYESGQIISAIERGLQNIAPAKMKIYCENLNINNSTMKRAMIKDTEEFLDRIV